MKSDEHVRIQVETSIVVATGISDHATDVGLRLFGSAGIAPDINGIDCYERSDWLGDGFLRGTSAGPAGLLEPLPETTSNA